MSQESVFPQAQNIVLQWSVPFLICTLTLSPTLALAVSVMKIMKEKHSKASEDSGCMPNPSQVFKKPFWKECWFLWAVREKQRLATCWHGNFPREKTSPSALKHDFLPQPGDALLDKIITGDHGKEAHVEASLVSGKIFCI